MIFRREVAVRTLIAASFLAVFPILALAADNPDWAYPVAPRDRPPPDAIILKTLPGSSKQYTQAQIDDPFNPPDWYPDQHPPAPAAVTKGTRPAGNACAQCHLMSGNGHPESSDLAGLPAPYIVRQMAAFKNGERKGIRATSMINIAKAITDEDVRAAAEYYAALKPTPGYNKVVETDTVPKSYIGGGAMRFVTAGGGDEPIGARIIVVPQDEPRAHMRDPNTGFIDYVPKGSLVKGAALMAGGDGKTVACPICHGPTLKGLGEVPSIAGRPAQYIFRQLNDMKTGNRAGPWVELMKQTVAKLTDDDMIALSAYLESLDP
jgi:cytochrome c553